MTARRTRVVPLGPGDPRRVGDYELRGLIGRGGMGSVYLGASRSGRLVAVKVVRSEVAAEPDFRRLFRREVSLGRRVARFCTAEVLDADPDGQPPFLVTEFVDGPNLWEAVRQDGPLDPTRLDRLAVAVATALTAIHRAGTVHRDLKPANVLLSEAGPLVIDFGIAHALDATATVTHSVRGTPAFMAPEQVLGEPVTAAADVFAWGGVVVYAATGRAPFGLARPEVLLYRVVHDRPDLDGVPEPLRTVVARAMRLDPAERPTAQQLLLDLTAASPPVSTAPSSESTHVIDAPPPADIETAATLQADAALVDPAPPGPSAYSPPTRERRRRLVTVAALVVSLVVATVVAVVALRPGPGSGSTATPSDPPGSQPSNLSTPSTGPSPATAPTAAADLTLILTAHSDSWIDVRDQDDQVLTQRLLTAGEKETIVTDESARVRLGNSGGVDVRCNGVDLGRQGGVGEVVTVLLVLSDGACLRR